MAGKTYVTWIPDYSETEETGVDIEASDAEDAAEKRHERWNDGGDDHTSSLTIHVRDGDRVRVFDTEADYVVNYYAYETKASREGKGADDAR